MTALLRRLWGSAPPRQRPTPAALFALADRRRRIGRAAEASRLVAAGLAQDPDNLTGHLLAAYLHLAARTIEPARGEFTWILRREPRHPRALLGLARIALEEGDVDACRESLSRALELYPDFPEARALLGATTRTGPGRPAASALPLERLRIPTRARALLVLGADGAVRAARPESLASHGERLARTVTLATAALRTAGLGRPRRAVLESSDEVHFVRTDPVLTVALALSRTTHITPGLLEVNRMWAAVGHDGAERVS